jgi:hypothetical protein
VPAALGSAACSSVLLRARAAAPRAAGALVSLAPLEPLVEILQQPMQVDAPGQKSCSAPSTGPRAPSTASPGPSTAARAPSTAPRAPSTAPRPAPMGEDATLEALMSTGDLDSFLDNIGNGDFERLHVRRPGGSVRNFSPASSGHTSWPTARPAIDDPPRRRRPARTMTTWRRQRGRGAAAAHYGRSCSTTRSATTGNPTRALFSLGSL